VTAKRSDVILNTDAHRPARDRFVHYLNAVTRREGWRSWEAIGHWLDASFRAMRGATLQHAPEPIDFIGPIFSEFAASAQLGQFFTPHHLSMLMAGMTIDDPRKMLEQSKRGFITLQEPACGVGGMTLAACAVLREHGIDLARQVHWTLIDIDYAATCAAYVQVNLCGISADVFHGNTLSLETWLATPTLMAILHPKRLRYDPSAVLPASSPAERSAIKPVQLSLFADDKPAVAAARKRRSA
jgi:hypothetical protein